MARFRATTNYQQRRVEARGKRTGVSIHSQEIQVQDNGFEDPDAFFTQPKSPEKENPAERAKATRFSLGSLHQDDASSASAPTKRMMGRVKGSTSPSDLSRVSTAPASPVRKQPEEESPEPIVEHSDNAEEEEVAREAPAVFDDDVEEEIVADEEKASFQPRNDDDTVNNASVVEEDDFMPPGPPDSPERDDESQIPTQMNHSIDFPTQTSEDEFSEEEADDDPGYKMPSSKTPQSAKILRKDKQSSKKASKKRKKAQFVESSEDEREMRKKKTKPAKKSRYATVFSPKGIPLPLQYETLPVDDFREVGEVDIDGNHCRRSKRARCPPLAYWKNEKMQYGPNDDMDANSDVQKMPIPKGIVKAKPTPYKPRTVRPRPVSASAKKKGKGSSGDAADYDNQSPPAAFDSRKLRKKYKYMDDEEATLWEDATEEAQEMKVVAYNSRVQYHKLPMGKNRTKAEGNVVGKAAQAFSFVQPPDSEYVGYIMGNLTLPPKGIKDAESVGSCAQTFTVVGGQPGAVEVAYADPEEDENGTLKPESAIRFLLGPGDMFRVPPGNCYRLQNHSKTTECFMTWTIIRPHVAG